MSEPRNAALEGSLRTTDGRLLFWRGWTTPSPRAVLVIVHGLAEHSGRYGHVGRHFAARGWAAYALDTRGHGRSPGPRVHVADFAEFLADVGSMAAFAREQHPGLPLFMLGHSQGGLVTLHHALRHPEGLAGIVVDPLVSRRVSPGWYAALRRAQAEVRAGAGRLGVPALVLASPDDRLVDPAAIRRFAADAPAGRIEESWWPGLSHELLNEPEREEVLAAIDAWLGARLQNTLMER